MMSNSDYVALKCNCRKGYISKRCACHKNGKKCNQNCHSDDINCGNVAEQIIDHIDRPNVSMHNNKEMADSEAKSMISLAFLTLRKRAATQSGPKQLCRKKQTPIPCTPSAEDPFSATDSLHGGPLRRRKPT